MNIKILKLNKNNIKEWIKLRIKLWPDCTVEECQIEFNKYIESGNKYFYILGYSEGNAICFLEGRIRDYAEGCKTNRVGYLEGWYVHEDYRNKNIGKKLLNEFLNWCKARDITEIGSDALIDNEDSHNAHLATGFKEIERSIHYLMNI